MRREQNHTRSSQFIGSECFQFTVLLVRYCCSCNLMRDHIGELKDQISAVQVRRTTPSLQCSICAVKFHSLIQELNVVDVAL